MIEFSHVSKLFGTQKAVNDLNLNFQEGSFSVLIGTSGSGKSTTLKMINRLVEHDSGVIRFAGEEIRSLPVLELRRRMGYAIQSIGLFPHWSVAQNIATVPQLQKWSRARIDDRIDELMALLGLEPNLRERYPHQLSGGQQQRVGVARALAADPQVLLMDEPFGALDPVTRGALQQEMTRIHRLLGRTIVLVTHDIDEALRLAEHLVLMDHGEVVQQGNPLTMLTRPANDFVRQFFGHSELGVRLLSLRSVADYVRREERAEGEALAEEMTLRDALSLFVARGCEVLPVVNTQGEPCGTLNFRICWRRRNRMKMLRDQLFWLIALFVALIFWLPYSQPLFAALFPQLPRPVYQQESFAALALAHFWLVGISSLFAVIIGTGAGIAVTRPWGAEFRPLVETIAAVGQTFPPVAVLAIAVPVIGFGLKPAIIALILYGVLPVLQATLAGLGAIDASVTEVAKGMGMSRGQRLRKVELPLAAPVILAGVRTSVIINIGTATIASTVGANTLGTPIIIGLSGFNTAYVIQGALLVALAAIIADRLFERLVQAFSQHAK